jgi:hypothetical protein
MSEYQYYEFRAIDRPLVQKEMDELRALSTRAEITPTSFTNTYHWGDFKGNPDTLMDRYFDAFVYVANWGTHQLMFRIPRRFLDVEAASAYCDDEVLSLTAKKEHVILEFSSRDEDGDGDEWTEGEHWMSSLISLRAELMRGDTRALYLGWLASLPSRIRDDEDGWDEEDGGDEEDLDDDDRLEPPVPPGLAKLSAPLRALADFLRVEDELIEVAAAGSAGEPPAEPSRNELARWVKGLPAADKDAYLLRFLAEEGDFLLRAELSKRFRESTAPSGARPALEAGRRTVAQLLAARDALVDAKRRKAAEREARERARREREQAEARARYLDDLARREPATWREVEEKIATKLPKEYDRAVELLVDLRDLAGRSGRTAEAEARILELRQRHSKKPSLMQRFDAKKLGK